MASQAQIISEINLRTDQASAMAAARGPKRGAVYFALRLSIIPSMSFIAAFLRNGGPLGGMEGFRKSVNAWAEKFIFEAKLYELCHADKNKSILESRDFG